VFLRIDSRPRARLAALRRMLARNPLPCPPGLDPRTAIRVGVATVAVPGTGGGGFVARVLEQGGRPS